MIVTPAASAPPTAFVYLLGALGTGGLLTVLWQMYLRWRRGGTEDEELVSRISNQVAEGSAKLLEEYRLELEVAKRQIELYLGQVTELNRLLGSANERIDRLERQLNERQSERRELSRQLKDAIRRREEVLADIRRLAARVRELERAAGVPDDERHELPQIEGLDDPQDTGARRRD